MRSLNDVLCLWFFDSEIVMDSTTSKDLDLSKYISADKLSAMSDLERKCCVNRIQNYEMMKSLGIVSWFKINLVIILLASFCQLALLRILCCIVLIC